MNARFPSDQLMFARFYPYKNFFPQMEKFGCVSSAAALNITNGGDEKENWRPLSATQKNTQRSDFYNNNI